MRNKKEYTEMTTDAKVGLLLGLVFIVIIAFVINGLPDFVHSFKDKPVVETAVTTQTGSNLVIDPGIVEVARSLPIGRTNLRYAEPSSQVMNLDAYAGGSDLPQTVETTTAALQNPPAAEAVTPTQAQSQLETAAAQPSQPRNPNTFSNRVTAVAPRTTSELSPVAQTSQADAIISHQTAQTIKAAQQAVQDVQQPAKSRPEDVKTTVVSGKTHVVGKGESLAAIAKKYYGPEIGNQRATIQMLYETNKDVLDSVNVVKVGDKLVIPQIAGSQPAQTEKPKTASTSLMDKFKNVFESADTKKEATVKNSVVADKAKENTTAKKTDAAPVNGKAKSAPAEREYVVQSGDHLYKIAQKHLGNGDRYPEIIALNKDQLSNPSQLQVGMKLKLPK
ncbi:MAG TPA: LysM peptidoglycan-binding domain-containing protein [Anaerohalosphaeraceae bacterium]|nr:LysM peptidoglycan-binding domain-containing protein [Anaerohalosphaeraceae bacterium]